MQLFLQLDKELMSGSCNPGILPISYAYVFTSFYYSLIKIYIEYKCKPSETSGGAAIFKNQRYREFQNFVYIVLPFL